MSPGTKALIPLASLLVVNSAGTPAQASTPEAPTLVVELEGGPVWQSRNDVQIPNDLTATRFSLVDVVGNGLWPSPRLYVTWNMTTRHGLRVLLAPLSTTETKTLSNPVDFAGQNFSAGAPTMATYTFNSWRLTYRYRFHHGESWTWWVGFTSKIRDAKVRLDQVGTSAEKTDVGFVPLLHISGVWKFQPRWALNLDLDALAGGPGQAEDLSLKLRYKLDDRWSLAGGYRLLEGGADVDDVSTSRGFTMPSFRWG